jgi:uncharacterized protein with PIN domain
MEVVVDSSAIIAIIFDEAMKPALLRRTADDADCLLSMANYVEVGTVMVGQRAAVVRRPRLRQDGRDAGLVAHLTDQLAPLGH